VPPFASLKVNKAKRRYEIRYNLPMAFGYMLWFLLFLFFLRVIGQVLVVLYQPRWFPPMPQWYSGLIPYRYLLPIQILFLLVMGWMSYDVTRGQGFFAVSRPVVGQGLIWFSYVYFGSMVVRYVIRMTRRPDQRWFGGTIPIIFHCVLAIFLYVFGRSLIGH
jgi:hypothetical protein